MRCAISSRAGQILAKVIWSSKDENGELRLDFRTDGEVNSGTNDPDGDLTSASKVLFRQLFETWRMSDMTLTAKLNS